MDKECSKMIFDEVKNGTITSWAELEMKSILYGSEVDSDFLKMLIEEYISYPVYTLIYKTLVRDNSMDRYFEDADIITHMILRNGCRIIKTGLGCEDNVIFKFDSFHMLKKLDERNPRYLLKYFLKNDTGYIERLGNGPIMDDFFNLLLITIERTRVRAAVSDTFKSLLERLEELYSEMRTEKMSFM